MISQVASCIMARSTNVLFRRLLGCVENPYYPYFNSFTNLENGIMPVSIADS